MLSHFNSYSLKYTTKMKEKLKKDNYRCSQKCVNTNFADKKKKKKFEMYMSEGYFYRFADIETLKKANY